MAESARPAPAQGVEEPYPLEPPAEEKLADLADVGKEAVSDSDSDIEVAPAPPLHGHMNKQSPAMLRLGGWDQRFFLLADMKIMWWVNMNSCLSALDSSDPQALMRRISSSEGLDVGTSSKKGMVNFELTSAVVEVEPGSETIFSMKPVNKWAKGSTTDIRDDDRRVYKFDCKGSEHSREQWLEVLSEHIQKGAELRAAGRARVSECWEDGTISQDQLAAAARLVKKLEGRKKR